MFAKDTTPAAGSSATADAGRGSPASGELALSRNPDSQMQHSVQPMRRRTIVTGPL